MKVIKLIENGSTEVICDCCDKNYTFESNSGGFIFCSTAYCPNCANEALKQIKAYNEERHIKAFCPSGESFWNFVVNYRNGRGRK